MVKLETRYKFKELVNIAAFEKLLESFFRATGVPNGLVGENGEIITQAGWINACALFHRKYSQSNLDCQQSNFELMHRLKEGEIVHAVCKNGLIDYATPIVIEDERLATLFLGQVLDRAPDITFFKKRATLIGYDESAYLEAIHAVPIVSKEQMEALMTCMVDMARMLAQSGLDQLRQNRLENDLNQSKQQRIALEDILDSSPIGIGWADSKGKIEYLNRHFTELFGYTRLDIPYIFSWYKRAFPDKNYRKRIAKPWRKEVYHNSTSEPPALEATVTCKDGSERYVMIHGKRIKDKWLFNFSDMTAHWKSEQRNITHDSILAMVAKGAPLSTILNAIVKTMESEDSDALCSILLLDKEEKHLHNGAAPSLPDFYNEAIDGIEIGIGVGSCGTAAATGTRVIVENIMNHEYWAPYRGLAKRANLAACWSEPIISSKNRVLGTVAIYHRRISSPTKEDIDRISFGTNLAAVAIENHNVRNELEQRAYLDFLTGLQNRGSFIEKAEQELARHHRYNDPFSLIMFDLDHFKRINDSYGHSIGDLVLRMVADVSCKALREIDIIGRIGGEEFAIVLPHTEKAVAAEVAERLRTLLEASKVQLEGGESLTCTASFGVTATHEHTTKIDTLLLEADAALYQAKAKGKNRVEIA